MTPEKAAQLTWSQALVSRGWWEVMIGRLILNQTATWRKQKTESSWVPQTKTIQNLWSSFEPVQVDAYPSGSMLWWLPFLARWQESWSGSAQLGLCWCPSWLWWCHTLAWIKPLWSLDRNIFDFSALRWQLWPYQFRLWGLIQLLKLKTQSSRKQTNQDHWFHYEPLVFCTLAHLGQRIATILVLNQWRKPFDSEQTLTCQCKCFSSASPAVLANWEFFLTGIWGLNHALYPYLSPYPGLKIEGNTMENRYQIFPNDPQVLNNPCQDQSISIIRTGHTPAEVSGRMHYAGAGSPATKMVMRTCTVYL